MTDLTTSDSWARWQRRVEDAPDVQSVRAALQDIAFEVHGRLGPAKTLRDEWLPIGVRVELADLGVSGVTTSSRHGRRVLIRRGESLGRRRYTVAHEIGHLLLRAWPNASALDYLTEERYCDEFARRALLPPAMVRGFVAERGAPEKIDDLLSAARELRVTPSLLIGALRGSLACGDRAFASVAIAGHPKRPAAVAFRFAATASPEPVFLPSHQRLASAGLTRLVRWIESAPAGARGRDEDRVTLRGMHRHLVGPCAWEAVATGVAHTAAIIALDTSALSLAPSSRRTRSFRKTADQLALPC